MRHDELMADADRLIEVAGEWYNADSAAYLAEELVPQLVGALNSERALADALHAAIKDAIVRESIQPLWAAVVAYETNRAVSG